jgi:hypothetical protein
MLTQLFSITSSPLFLWIDVSAVQLVLLSRPCFVDINFFLCISLSITAIRATSNLFSFIGGKTVSNAPAPYCSYGVSQLCCQSIASSAYIRVIADADAMSMTQEAVRNRKGFKLRSCLPIVVIP